MRDRWVPKYDVSFDQHEVDGGFVVLFKISAHVDGTLTLLHADDGSEAGVFADLATAKADAFARVDDWLEDFGEQDVRWDGATETLLFHVSVDGTQFTAGVTGECLSDHCGMQAGEPVNAAKSFWPRAETLRRLAEGKIRAGEEPLIRTKDWHD